MRASGTYRQLLCHSCNRQWGQVVFSYSEDWTKPVDTPTCTCPTSHIEILPRPGTSSSAQCRASQRAVYYELPTGEIAAVETNSYTDPGALAAVARGGIRHEIHSVREMQRLHREWQPGDADPTSWGQDRNLVIDYDSPTIRSGSANHPLRQRIERDRDPRQQHNPFQSHDSGTTGSTIRIIPGGEVYEQARDDYRRRSRG